MVLEALAAKWLPLWSTWRKVTSQRKEREDEENKIMMKWFFNMWVRFLWPQDFLWSWWLCDWGFGSIINVLLFRNEMIFCVQSSVLCVDVVVYTADTSTSCFWPTFITAVDSCNKYASNKWRYKSITNSTLSNRDLHWRCWHFLVCLDRIM